MTMINVLAQAGAPGLEGFILPIAMVGLFYFLGIRPQQKKQKEDQAMRSALKKNDEVITIGGIHGVVTYTSEKTVKLKVSESSVITLDKSAIASKSSAATAEPVTEVEVEATKENKEDSK